MGEQFSLLLLAVLGFIVACIIGLIIWRVAARAVRNSGGGRRKLVMFAAMYPFICLLWAAGVSGCQRHIEVTVLHHDSGYGDSFYVTLPNGYRIGSIDDLEDGWVFNPRLKAHMTGFLSEEAGVEGVRNLQVAGQYILGESSGRVVNPSGADFMKPPYFILDTASAAQTRFDTYEALQDAARKLDIAVALRPFRDIYSECRSSWYDAVFRLLFWVPPALGWIMLIRRFRYPSREVPT